MELTDLINAYGLPTAAFVGIVILISRVVMNMNDIQSTRANTERARVNAESESTIIYANMASASQMRAFAADDMTRKVLQDLYQANIDIATLKQQVLNLTIDIEDFKTDAATAKAQYLRLKADYDRQTEEFNQIKALLDQKIGSEERLIQENQRLRSEVDLISKQVVYLKGRLERLGSQELNALASSVDHLNDDVEGDSHG